MIKTVIWDIGRVLLGFDWFPYIYGMMDKETADTVTEAMWGTGYWYELDRAVLTLPELLELFYSAAPEYKDELKMAYREAMAEDIVQKNLMDNRNNYRRQLLIELYTGMRMGEINALKPENIDFKKKVIHVSGTISMGINNSVYRSDHTKTNAGMRDVPINDRVRPILEEALADVKPNKEGTIFYDYIKNDVVSTSQVCCFFRRICEKAGIPYYGQHALRHTFATRCIESGIQPVVLKKWMGHTNIHITLDTYSDVFDNMNNNAIDVFEAFVRDNAV